MAIRDFDVRAPKMASGRFQLLVLGAVAIVASVVCVPYVIEEVYQDEIVAIQAPVTGKIHWYTTPGWAYQGFGTVMEFKKRYTLNFSKNTVPNQPTGGLLIRFADGGHATIYGSVQFKMPDDEKNLSAILSGYRTDVAVQENLLKTVLNKSIYLSGTLMTSKESYAEKRNDLIHYVTDQMQNGVYRTKQTTKWIKDEITGQSKEITQAEILLDDKGQIMRQESSVLDEYHITAYNFTINEMPYDDVIEGQIKQQQKITMDVQTSIAQAKQKDQEALTAEAEGRANAARAKWEQETIKARETTKADQEKTVALTNASKEKEVAETAAKKELTVADFARQTAEQYKQRLILEGEGEAAKRRAILAADGALQQKLEAYKDVQGKWAAAFAQYHGNVVPSYVGAGATGQGSGNGAQQFMDLMTMKAAKDMQLDLSINNVGAQK